MASDSILIVGSEDERLKLLLKKLGYLLVENQDNEPLPNLISQKVVDLVIVDSRTECASLDLCHYLREENVTKKVPIVCLVENKEKKAELESQGLDRLELVDVPYQVGKLATKIATLLRLRKMAGSSDVSATLSEMNAALRDLNNRFKRDVEEARAIQQSLLPRELPKGNGFQIAVSYQPLDTVGGDWYYVKSENDGKVMFQIADVTGHGLAAAFIGCMTKLALSAAGHRLPHELHKEMNHLMTPQIPEGRFVTIASFLYDPKTGHIDFSSAGHPPALVLRRKNNEVVELRGKGFALGFFDESEYSHETILLESNDIIVLVTDGITEAQNRDFKCYGYAGISQVLKASAPTDTAQGVLERIHEDFKKFLDGRILKDDVTVIVLKRGNNYTNCQPSY